MRRAKFTELLGRTLTGVEVRSDEIVFTTDEGRVFKQHHYQDCCESVTVEDVCGHIDDLIGSPILLAEEVIHDNENPDGSLVAPPGTDYYGSFTWTFYRLATAKGFVTIRWFGTSNGYYSESVDFAEIEVAPCS